MKWNASSNVVHICSHFVKSCFNIQIGSYNLKYFMYFRTASNFNNKIRGLNVNMYEQYKLAEPNEHFTWKHINDMK